MPTATMFEAKTNLSDLLKKAQRGEGVIITSGRDKVPVARLEAIHPVRKKRLGVLADPAFVLTEAFYAPLSEEDLKLWNGEGESETE